jgi:two-component system, sensor histidine kinase and response regulator
MSEATLPVNILLVDDKQENLFALETLLARDDRTIFKASSGNDALKLLLKHDFALVLLDVEMPDMDGYETAQLMRSLERTRRVPIIFVTAGDRSDERTFKGYEAGAVDFLYKPINAHTLSSKVAVFLDLHRMSAELARTTAVLRERVTDLEYVHQTLSHDLRAPLRTVRAFSEVLSQQRDALSAEGIDAVDRIQRASARMTAMIEDLYGVLRLTAEQPHETTVDMNVVVRDVTEALRADIDRTHATITCDVLPTLRTSRRFVMQIMQNLVSNALAFHGTSPPHVRVSAQRRAHDWAVSIHDNGVGIPAAERERLFKLFSRLDPMRSGSGVGLALCKRAVEKLGGKIWLGAETGPGATFHFTIPDHSKPAA